MKKVSVWAMVLICSLFWVNAALARSMTVENKSNAALDALNISKDGGDNVSNMLKSPLAKGKSVSVNLDGGNEGWNVLAIGADGEAHVGEKLNFVGKSKIIVSGGGIQLQ